jgi:hypothetical protein
MGSTAEDTTTRTMRLRVTFESEQPLSIVDAQDYVYGLGGFLFYGFLIAQLVQPLPPGLSISPSLREVRESSSAAKQAVRDTRLERLSYNSPLEVTLAIPTAVGATVAAGGATFIGRSILRLFTDFQAARVAKADADVQVAIRREILAQLHRRNVTREHIVELDLGSLIDAAVVGAATISTIVLEGEESA